MSQSSDYFYKPESKMNWPVSLFLLLTPFLTFAAVGTYVWFEGFEFSDLGIFALMYLLTGLSITVGYHRYYAHRAFDCHPVIQWALLIFGAAAVQNSLANWATEHRYHHRFCDHDGDPYNINRGFFWAHLGWMLPQYRDEVMPERVKDLLKDSRVAFQHKYYSLILVLVGFGLPTLMGAFFDRPLAGFLWGGWLRMTICHHCTFMINSVAHTFGKKTHSSVLSARDNFWLALVSFGEGYHSYHHAYPSDYRNGTAWYHWDPSKWIIRGLSAVGLTWNLRTPTPRSEEQDRSVARVGQAAQVV